MAAFVAFLLLVAPAHGFMLPLPGLVPASAAASSRLYSMHGLRGVDRVPVSRSGRDADPPWVACLEPTSTRLKREVPLSASVALCVSVCVIVGACGCEYVLYLHI